MKFMSGYFRRLFYSTFILGGGGVVFHKHILLAHLAHSAKVSFWDRALSVVRRRPSSVVRQQFT